MKIPQNRWTVDYLASLPDDELDRIGRRIAGSQTVCNLITGRVMMAMERTSLPERRGLSGAVHYFALEGRERKDALDCRRVARACENLPLIREAAETGTLGWTYLREIVRVASPETEATWLDLCKRYSTGMIQQLVKNTSPGGDPLKTEATIGNQPVETELRVTLPAELNALLGQVVRELSGRARTPLSMRAVIECMVAQHLTGTPFAGSRSSAGLMARAAHSRWNPGRKVADDVPCFAAPALPGGPRLCSGDGALARAGLDRPDHQADR